MFAIVGRYATTGGDDLAQVWALQEDTWLTPLSRYPQQPDNSQRTLGNWDLAPYDERVSEGLKFWEQMRSWMQLFPPSEIDQAYQNKFESLGLLADESPFVDPDPALVETLKAGRKNSGLSWRPT